MEHSPITSKTDVLALIAEAKAKGKQVRRSVEGVRGLSVLASPGGTGTFQQGYRLKGKANTYTIGRFTDLSVAKARDMATAVLADVAKGIDPAAAKRAAATAKSMADLVKQYRLEHLPTLSLATKRDYENLLTVWIETDPLYKKHIADVTEGDCRKFFARVSKRIPRDKKDKQSRARGGNRRANLALVVLGHMLRMAIRSGTIASDPTAEIKQHPENRRETFLSEKQAQTLLTALTSRDTLASCALKLALLTGQRIGAVVSLQWGEIGGNAETGFTYWEPPKETNRTKRRNRVPLSAAASDLLKHLHKKTANLGSGYVFPNQTEHADDHIKSLKREWRRVCKEIKLPGVRIHDLRHSHAAFLIAGGESLAVVGRLLGHADYSTTTRYAHVADEVARKAVDKVGTLVSS